MVVKVFKRISYGEEERFEDEPILINATYTEEKKQRGQVFDGMPTLSISLTLTTIQSPINDKVEANKIDIGDMVEVNGKKHTIKNSSGIIYLNFNHKGRRKYIFEL